MSFLMSWSVRFRSTKVWGWVLTRSGFSVFCTVAENREKTYDGTQFCETIDFLHL